ncbi:unnamed protein product, partial [Thlaspi arvense]
VGSGSIAHFWLDDWTDLGPLIDLTGPTGPQVTGRHLITTLLKSVIPPISNLSTTTYTFKWRNSANEVPKHAFIHSVIARDRLPTRDRLQSWGLQVSDLCLLCSTDTETRDHLFFSCPFSASVWRSFFSHPSLNPPPSYDDIVTWVRNYSLIPKVTVIKKLLLHAVLYELWKERNSRLHSTVSKQSVQVIREVQALMRQKLAGLDRPLQHSLNYIPHEASYLST